MDLSRTCVKLTFELLVPPLLTLMPLPVPMPLMLMLMDQWIKLLMVLLHQRHQSPLDPVDKAI